MIDSDFEQRLIDALQPVRGLVLAQTLHFAMHSDLWNLLAAGGVPAGELAAKLDMSSDRLTVVLDYLANEGYVLRDLDGYRLSRRGADLTTFAPWYRLLVGGYSTTFESIGDTLRAGAPYGSRDGTAVGQGSCGISAYDAIPLIRQLLSRLPHPADHLVDLGCGDGTVLLDLAANVPAARLVGVDPHAQSVVDARASADRLELRAVFHEADGATFVQGRPKLDGTACYVTAFVLQEILEQHGRDAVVGMVRDVLGSAEEAYLVVIEVDWQIDNPSVMRHGLALAYYNPYYLVHGLTEQRLADRDFWRAVAEEAGGAVIAVGEVDPAVDSTGLEFGYLIGPAKC
jgi:2-ketoarginine methyltransferase